MTTEHSTAVLAREQRYVTLVARRHDLSAEARGNVRHGAGRSPDAIRAVQAAVEAEFAALMAERA